MRTDRAILRWFAFATAVFVPVVVALMSPLLAWREPVYIVAGFAGVIAMVLLLAQPLLIGGDLPGLAARRGARVHRVVGGALVGAVIVHVAGLWITSPPDVIDALLFRSPTPFTPWGVIAMWAIFVAAVLAVFRRRLRPRTWRVGHMLVVAAGVTTSTVHAMLIEGTMGGISKAVLCGLAVGATAKVMANRKPWRLLSRRSTANQKP
ncbi:ferric reductase-like transmembrane domain-containing protein [Puniceibacterium sp. IMCC21224]|uniref:ferric reductase-like transmembrane domain-containing protein n=1 Tax=Puniceibacterium sp. IMCC21224 TaxID=1618204 RepID=UPI00064DE490|nr:ferric reductase-like transmembrane domain-containing protein [Puniceibacterium sp. IMCC21224]KMK67558.1 Ferric reductase like transmembrane component [Puniceibacterium sp. IMCC21224]